MMAIEDALRLLPTARRRMLCTRHLLAAKSP
jgi:hypothetical protein